MFDEAIEEVKKALAHKPSASPLLRQMGLLHFKTRKNAIAEKCLLKAVSVNDQDTIPRVYLADYYLKKNELEKAGIYYLENLFLSTRYNDKCHWHRRKASKDRVQKDGSEDFFTGDRTVDKNQCGSQSGH